MKNVVISILLFGLFAGPVNAAVLNPGDSVTFYYDLSGASYTGPFSHWNGGLAFGASNPWELGDSVNLKLFDSSNFLLMDLDLTNPFIDPLSVTTSSLLLAQTSDLMGSFVVTSIDSAFDLVLEPVNFHLRLGSDFSTQADATFSLVPPAAVPLPAAAWLFGTALIGFIGFSRRRKAV